MFIREYGRELDSMAPPLHKQVHSKRDILPSEEHFRVKFIMATIWKGCSKLITGSS